LMKEDGPAKPADSANKGVVTKTKIEGITKEQVQKILEEIIKSQDQMKGHMKVFTKELLSKELTFEQTYQRVREVQPTDPLEKYGLSMYDFDQLLDKHQQDPIIREAISTIMGAPNASSTASEKVQSLSVKQIIDVHKFMLQELKTLAQDFQKMPNKGNYDMKTVTIAAQAIVGARIEKKFDMTSEDIESAVLMYHTVLATDKDFASINIQIQQTMSKLMGSDENFGMPP